MAKRIPIGTTVRINCPTAKGVHGKTGVIKSFNSAGRDIYAVTIPDLQFRPSFLYFEELEVLSESQTQEVSGRITIKDVVTEYGEEDAARFAFELLEFLGHELDRRDGETAVYDLGGE